MPRTFAYRAPIYRPPPSPGGYARRAGGQRAPRRSRHAYPLPQEAPKTGGRTEESSRAPCGATAQDPGWSECWRGLLRDAKFPGAGEGEGGGYAGFGACRRGPSKLGRGAHQRGFGVSQEPDQRGQHAVGGDGWGSKKGLHVVFAVSLSHY